MMPPLWWYPAMAAIIALLVLEFGRFKFMERFNEKIGFDSWERVEFDWWHYSSLRRAGLSHKEAIRELDRMWKERGA